MYIFFSLVLIAIAIAFWIAVRRGWISGHTLQNWANIAGVISMLAAIAIFILQAVDNTQPGATPTPTAISTLTPIPTTTLAPTNTPIAGIKLPYSNNFDEGSHQVWIVIGNEAKPIGGAYEVNGNPIVVTLLPGSDAWQDYSLTARVKIISGKGDFGIVARASEDCRFYLLQYVEKYVRIVRFDGGECSSEHHIRVVTAFVPYEIHLGTWYTFRVDVQGTKITGYVDGVQVISVEDASYSHGKVGFRANTTQMLFDDMKVVFLPP